MARYRYTKNEVASVYLSNVDEAIKSLKKLSKKKFVNSINAIAVDKDIAALKRFKKTGYLKM